MRQKLYAALNSPLPNRNSVSNIRARYYKTILVGEVLDWLKAHAAPLMLQVWCAERAGCGARQVTPGFCRARTA